MTDQPENRVVWAEIPATDLKRAMNFYSILIGEPIKEDTSGPQPMAFLPCANKEGVAGHIYEGKPAKDGEGPTVHLTVDCGLQDAMARVKDAGGKVVSDVFSIPAGSFFYACDTEGNSIGVFKA